MQKKTKRTSGFVERKEEERKRGRERDERHSTIRMLTAFESAVIFAERIISDEPLFYNLLMAVIKRPKELRPETDFSTKEAVMENRASMNDALVAAVRAKSLEFEEKDVMAAQVTSKGDQIKFMNEKKDNVITLAEEAPVIKIETAPVITSWQ